MFSTRRQLHQGIERQSFVQQGADHLLPVNTKGLRVGQGDA
jgi:hypothetical protein